MPSFERFTTADFEFELEKKTVDTVLVAFGDSQGRLVGRRVTVDFYTSQVLQNGMRVPSFLLTTDSSGQMAPGFALASATTGFRDLILKVDTASMFRMPWQPGTVGVLGDLQFEDGTAVTMSPRTVLERQAQRAEAASLTASIGIEPQFTVLADPDTVARAGHLTSRSFPLEQLMRRIRLALNELPVPIEGTAGLMARGHYEITMRPDDPLRVCDGALLLRDAVRAIARIEGADVTFMACPEEDTASAAHVNISLRGFRGGSGLADRYGEGGLSEIGRAFIAGQLEHAAELFLLYAPNVNSYRRFGTDPLTPSALNWGLDNRTCAIRVSGSDVHLRVENRLAGSDANPYLTASAVLASGLDGIARQLHAPAPIEGDAHAAGSPPLPASLGEALAAWEGSAWVRSTFGPEVHDHYAAVARAELAAFGPGQPQGLEAERARYLDC